VIIVKRTQQSPQTLNPIVTYGIWIHPDHGFVAGWTDARIRAERITPELAEKVKAWAVARSVGGVLDFEEEPDTVQPSAKAA
jgi:hypothetical protein